MNNNLQQCSSKLKWTNQLYLEPLLNIRGMHGWNENDHSDKGIQLHSVGTIGRTCEFDLCIDEVLHGLHPELLQELNFLAFHLE